MPLYDYACSECGYTKEILCGAEDEPEVLCPKHKRQMDRQISVPTVHMKGIGVRRSISYQRGRADDPTIESVKEAANETKRNNF